MPEPEATAFATLVAQKTRAAIATHPDTATLIHKYQATAFSHEVREGLDLATTITDYRSGKKTADLRRRAKAQVRRKVTRGDTSSTLSDHITTTLGIEIATERSEHLKKFGPDDKDTVSATAYFAMLHIIDRLQTDLTYADCTRIIRLFTQTIDTPETQLPDEYQTGNDSNLARCVRNVHEYIVEKHGKDSELVKCIQDCCEQFSAYVSDHQIEATIETSLESLEASIIADIQAQLFAFLLKLQPDTAETIAYLKADILKQHATAAAVADSRKDVNIIPDAVETTELTRPHNARIRLAKQLIRALEQQTEVTTATAGLLLDVLVAKHACLDAIGRTGTYTYATPTDAQRSALFDTLFLPELQRRVADLLHDANAPHRREQLMKSPGRGASSGAPSDDSPPRTPPRAEGTPRGTGLTPGMAGLLGRPGDAASSPGPDSPSKRGKNDEGVPIPRDDDESSLSRSPTRE